MRSFKIKKGMLVHPFSDQSGVSLYSTESTVVTSVGLNESEFYALLANPDMNDYRHITVIDELLSKHFIEKMLD